MGYVKGIGRTQCSLFPQTLDELVPSEHMVRVIDAYVERLEMEVFSHGVAAATGRPSYDPSDLLKLYVYGYMNRVRSSRELERECERNMELMWLLGQLRPDHRTIARFRSENAKGLQASCARFVCWLREVGLTSGERVAIDGSKFKASAGVGSVMNAERLAKARERIAKGIGQYMLELDEADAREAGEKAPDRETLQRALRRLRARDERLSEAQEQMAQSADEKVSLTDADARGLRGAHGYVVGYNVQQAVEGENKLIVAHAVTQQANDQALLWPMAQAAQAALGKPEGLKVLADAGYMNAEHSHLCEAAGIIAVVPMQQATHTHDKQLYAKSEFTYDATTDSYRCPANEELQRYRRDRAAKKDYYRTKTCGQCRLKSVCTAAKSRSIARPWHAGAMEAAHQRAKDDRRLMRSRSALAEHPFGNLKRMLQGGFLVRTLAKVKGEMALAIQTYNLKRVFNILGFKQLMQHLQGQGS